jgi:hypothetical protein
MTEPDDLQLKAEIDEIMKHVDNIMKEVEIAIPPAENNSQPPGE